MAEEQLTLRDSLEEAFTEAEKPGQDQPPAAASVADTRARDEAGRFAKQEKERQEAQDSASPAAQQPEPVKRPSSWKKEYWDKYDALDPELRNYILQREGEFATGVSTYKSEAAAAKTLRDAVEPFMPELQRHGIDPAQWIRNLGNAHQTLALGSPQAKLAMFQRLAQDYGVPLQYLVPDQQGQTQQIDPTIQYLTQNLQGLQQQWQQFQSQQQALEQAQINSTIDEFKADTAKHPHFEALRQPMAALLQSGQAQNLDEAYDKALWMSPDTRAQVLAAQQQRDVASKTEAERAKVSKAKAQAVSPRSSTPGAQSANATAKKGLRDMLSEAFEGQSGRV